MAQRRPAGPGPDGGFWFGDWLTTIYRVGTSGLTTPFRIAPAGRRLRAIVAGPDGQLWFADQRSPAVFRMTTKGVVTGSGVPPGAPKAWESFGGMAVGRTERSGSPSPGRTRSPASPAAADPEITPSPPAGALPSPAMGIQADYVRKIQGLLATAESLADQGNEEAAGAYVAKAHALQQKYSIDQAMLAEGGAAPGDR